MTSAGKSICILVEDEKTYLLPTVERTIRLLNANGFRVTHIGVLPSKIGRRRGLKIPLWYLRVFGFWNTALLACFSGLEACRRLRAHYGPERLNLNWRQLKTCHGLDDVRFLRNPNDRAALEFLRRSNCDILFIMIPYVLRPATLAVPKIGTINKHAGLLPGCRGLFPYIWSIIHGKPLGVTFHEAIAEIDAGSILVQKRTETPPSSMIDYYLWVFRQFPEMALEAAGRIGNGRGGSTPGEVSKSDYFSVPARADYKQFRKAGGRIVALGDLRRSLVL